MNVWIEVKELSNTGRLDEYLVNLNNVTYVCIDSEYGETYLFIKTTDGTEFQKPCNSEIEAQMLYAKLKKMLCTNEELNEIL